ncbi:ankyrin repeat-containing domain protein [Boeremia exigua]|uniref:ankyrin repeat-containing domain protein n=1 Tax=Boeremia exigua TaxID=749465 RepID=UPI001E8DD8EB|nr:ankyrin repeat-containing domain protein [Boeremia exigua]KAH6612555.1 ankyrin repeat-containing domain protein [Boeremia exigua]
MAPPKKETSLQLCQRITTQGNTISIRMLEYLGTSKNAIPGFEALATEFIELCRTLWSIEAGLIESAKTPRHAIPSEVTQDLDRRFRQVSDEFSVLQQMVNKFVDNDSGKGGGFGRRFRMMFADTDVDKMRVTLSRSRDSLKVSSAMFRWTIGDNHTDPTMGIGYAGLIAALESINPSKMRSLPPIGPPPESRLPNLPSKDHSPHSDTLSPPSRLADRPSLNDMRPTPPHSHVFTPEARQYSSDKSLRNDDDMGLSAGIVDLHKNWRAPSVRSTGSVRDTMYTSNTNPSGRYHSEPVYEDLSSEDSHRSRMMMEEKLAELSVHERYMNESMHSSTKYDPSRLDSPMTSSWAPRHHTGSKAAGGKSAIVNAVEQRKHRFLEQLLDGGARAEPQVEAGMLRTAAQNRDIESLALLLQYGMDANGFDREGVTPLFAATQASCFESAKMLLKHNADVNLSAGPNSESPLSLAASENQIDFVQLYLSSGGNVNTIMDNGSTALVQAMNKIVSPKLVELLLTSGGDADAKTGEGTTAMFQAIQANRVDLMTVLLDHGANPNLPGPKHPLWPSTYKPKCLALLLARGADHKKTPGVMELASSLKKLESIKILIEAGVSPNLRKDGVYTPLCSAIRDDSREIVTYLLENGADPNFNASEYPAFKCITHKRIHFLPELVAAGVDLNSPKGIMETAVQFNDKDAMVFLFEHNVNPNDRTPEGNTALTTAIREGRGDLVDLLLTNGADPAIRGQDWPLCMAVKQPAILKRLLAATPNPRAFRGVIEMAVVANQLESIKLLLAAGVSVEDKNCGVFSPLTTAIREDRKDIVRYLLDVANADINAPGEHLPLVKALRRYHGDAEILTMLLSRGADINKMHRGWNGVLQAFENGDAEILKMMIDMGGSVDLQAIDESGKPVIDIVTERGWEEGLALLFPNAVPAAKVRQENHRRSFSISDWKWMSASLERGERYSSGDDTRTVSSGCIPGS